MPATESNPKNRLSPYERAQGAFPVEFLRRLGEKFKFDYANPEILESIRDIAQAYFVVIGRPKSLDFRKQARHQYLKLIKDIGKFQEVLEKAKAQGIDADMDLIARMRVPDDKPCITSRRQTSGANKPAHKYDELIQLLDLLAITAEHGKQIFSSRPGPKIDEALEVLVRGAADFWIYHLGRKFTIDHHKGTGTTKSFEFIVALASQLGDFPDTAIVNAMRANRTVRNKIDKSIQHAR